MMTAFCTKKVTLTQDQVSAERHPDLDVGILEESRPPATPTSAASSTARQNAPEIAGISRR